MVGPKSDHDYFFLNYTLSFVGDSRPTEVLLPTNIYNAKDILKFFSGFIQNFNNQIICTYTVDKDKLSGDLSIVNKNERPIMLRLHKSLSLTLGFISAVEDLFKQSDNYCQIILEQNKEFLFLCDASIMLKSMYMYTNFLFSYQNQIAEISLSKKDFLFMAQQNYSVTPIHCVTINSAKFSIERDKNVFFSNVYFTDILGEKIFFKSATVNGCLTFQL